MAPRLFVTPAVGNVAQISGEKQRAIRFEWCDCQLDQNFRSVTAETINFDAPPEHWAFTSSEVVRQAAPMLLAHPRRDNQFGQLFAYRFLAAKTEDALGRGIELSHNAICIHGDDA